MGYTGPITFILNGNKSSYFVQCVTLHTGEAFHPMEEALEKYFLLDLFKGSTTDVLPQGIT